MKFGELKEGQYFKFESESPVFKVVEATNERIVYGNGIGVPAPISRSYNVPFMERDVELHTDNISFFAGDAPQQEPETQWVDTKSWEEFRENGMLFVANQVLHFFGWAITLQVEDGIVKGVVPARVKFRGFDDKSQTEQHIKVAKYLERNATELRKEAEL